MKRKSVFILFIFTSLIDAGILTGLFTNYWLKGDDFNFGVLHFIKNGTDGDPQPVEEVLHNQRDGILTCRYLLISAAAFTGLIILILILLLCCSSCRENDARSNSAILVFAFLISCGLQLSDLMVFLIRIEPYVPLKSKSLGWSVYVEFATLGLTGLIFILLLTYSLCCENQFERSNAVEDFIELSFKHPPTDVSVNIGEEVTITTHVIKADEVYWNRGNQRVISFSKDYHEQFDKQTGVATLKIQNASFQYDGEYDCVAIKYGKSRKEIRHKFNVFVMSVTPTFMGKLEDVRVNTGDTMKLKVKVKNASFIVWYCNEILLQSKGNIRILFRQKQNASLTITNVGLKDRGEYTCKAICGKTVKDGKEDYTQCHVTVDEESPPSFGNVPKKKKVEIGDPLEVEITVHGFPRPRSVTWYKDDTRLETDSRITYQYLNGIAKLHVHETKTEDTGLYTCHIENQHGNEICRIPVKVKKKENNVVECMVCMDKKPNRRLECGHIICDNCVDRIQGVCPTCRAPFREHSVLYY